ncbi:MAG: cytochrome P460 family protein [Methylococcales bacterium]
MVLPYILKGYEKWKLIAVSHRNDKNSLRAILGNRSAHGATYANGEWNWPEGTILAKLVWEDTKHPQWPDAIVPGQLSHIEFMFKDRKKFASTGGWGFARWIGMELEPYRNDGSECFACHTKASANDFVFTRPAPLPWKT